MVGNYPPNHKLDFDRYFKQMYYEVLASAKVVALYHAMGLKGQIGIVHDSSNVEIAPGTKEPEKVRLLGDLFYNRLILDTSIKGELPGELIPLLRENGIENDYIKLDDALTFAKGKVIYWNERLQPYVPDRLVAGRDGGIPQQPWCRLQSQGGMRISWYETAIAPDTKRNLWGREIYPKCMYNTLMEIRERYGDIPVYITENGHGCYETPDENGYVQDDDRIEMMQGTSTICLRPKKRAAMCWATMHGPPWIFIAGSMATKSATALCAWTLTMTTSGPPKRAIIGSRI